MDRIKPVFKCVVAALFFWAAIFSVSQAQDSETTALLDKLRDPDLTNWEEVEQTLWQRWSESGSPTADFLLERGREAMEQEDWFLAIDHLTALIDHAPDFAEGYNARATAYYQADLLGPAMADIEATLALNPDHFGALMGLALILEKVGLDDDALGAYRAVAAIHPHRPNLQDAIERLERSLGDATL